jgi:hypothetical protein
MGQLQSSSGCFDSAGMMTVNGNPQGNQPMMTADRTEFVYKGNGGEVEVTRRLRIDPVSATVRCVEVLKNTKDSPANFSFKIVYQAMPPVIAVLTDKGLGLGSGVAPAPFPGPTYSSRALPRGVRATLSAKERGVLVLRMPGQGPSLVLYLPPGRDKADVSVENSRQLAVNYTVTIPPKSTVAILHGMAQRNITGTPDPKAAGALFKPFLAKEFLDRLPVQIRKVLLNSPGADEETAVAPLLAKVAELAEKWSVDRKGKDCKRFSAQPRSPWTRWRPSSAAKEDARC